MYTNSLIAHNSNSNSILYNIYLCIARHSNNTKLLRSLVLWLTYNVETLPSHPILLVL